MPENQKPNLKKSEWYKSFKKYNAPGFKFFFVHVS